MCHSGSQCNVMACIASICLHGLAVSGCVCMVWLYLHGLAVSAWSGCICMVWLYLRGLTVYVRMVLLFLHGLYGFIVCSCSPWLSVTAWSVWFYCVHGLRGSL